MSGLLVLVALPLMLLSGLLLDIVSNDDGGPEPDEDAAPEADDIVSDDAPLV